MTTTLSDASRWSVRAGLVLATLAGCSSSSAYDPVTRGAEQAAGHGESGVSCISDTIDEDKDGLSASDEAALGTSDLLADSDGDGLGDALEVAERERLELADDAGNMHFHPAVADLPRIDLQLLSEPVLAIAPADGSDEQWVDVSSAGSNPEHAATVVHQQVGTSSLAIEAGYLEAFQRISLELSGMRYTYSASIHNQELVVWEPSALTHYADTLAAASIEGEPAKAVLAVTMAISNASDVPVQLASLELSAQAWDPHTPNHGSEVAVLRHGGALEPGLETLVVERFGSVYGSAEAELTAADGVHRVVYTGEVEADSLRELLRESRGLTFTPRGKDGLGWLESRALLERTVEVLVDLGDEAPAHRYRVGVEPGTAVSVDTLLQRINITYGYGHPYVERRTDAPDIEVGIGLASVDSVPANLADGASYVIAITHDARGESPKTDVYTRINSRHDLFSKLISSGAVVHIVRVVDRDADGLGERLERGLLSSDLSADTDGDGLADEREALGWLLFTDDGPRHVFPLLNSADSDADGVGDWLEQWRESDPIAPLRFHGRQTPWMLISGE